MATSSTTSSGTRDPAQENDVAGARPDVVARLEAFYEAWWAELKPTFDQVPTIVLGHPRVNPVRLTSHDWIVKDTTPWNQSLVRMASERHSAPGFWNVKVVAAGRYEIRLRRWPEEADTAIDAPLPPAPRVPGESPFRASPGTAVEAVTASVRIGEAAAEARVEPGAKTVTVRLTLPAGRARMSAFFTTRDGNDVGAFYADVRNL